MTLIDSPIGRCEVVREMVLLDQTQAECTAEHGCAMGGTCPLAGCFYEVSGLSDEHARELAAREAGGVVLRSGRKAPAARLKNEPAAGSKACAGMALTP